MKWTLARSKCNVRLKSGQEMQKDVFNVSVEWGMGSEFMLVIYLAIFSSICFAGFNIMVVIDQFLTSVSSSNGWKCLKEIPDELLALDHYLSETHRLAPPFFIEVLGTIIDFCKTLQFDGFER